MTFQVGVKIFLQDEETGKYLVIRRAVEKYPDMAGKLWDIPGGRMEAGKPLLENLRRELTEEIGAMLRGEPKILLAQDILIPARDLHIVRLTYTGHATGEIVLSDEHDAYDWLTAQELVERVEADKITLEAAKLLLK